MTVLALLALTVIAPTVCLDPGHPSENGVGTKGKTLAEVAVCWDVALRVRDRLEAEGVRVVMTKSSANEKVTNKRRAEIANAAKADLMLRLHCDAAASRGFSVYYPARTGKVGGVTGPAKSVLASSAKAAKLFHPVFAAALKGTLPDRGLHTDAATSIGAKQGALSGSIHSEVPVLLVEMFVLTNPKDEALAATKEGLDAMAAALVKATLAVVQVTPPETSIRVRNRS